MACDIFIMLRIHSTHAGEDMCVTLLRCNRCPRNTCEVAIRKGKRKYECPPSSLEPPSGYILASFWKHFGISLVSFCIHFGIILEVSVRHRKWTHFGASQGSGPEPTLTGNFPVKALKMEMTFLTGNSRVKEGH